MDPEQMKFCAAIASPVVSAMALLVSLSSFYVARGAERRAKKTESIQELSGENMIETAQKTSAPEGHWDIIFKYHQEQWTHVRHHEQLRSALTLQILVFTAAVVAAYLRLNSGDAFPTQCLRAALAVLALVIGCAGIIAVCRIEKAASIHIDRARAARVSIGFLEPFATGNEKFPKLQWVYLSFHVIVAALGLILLVAVPRLPTVPSKPMEPPAGPSRDEATTEPGGRSLTGH